MSQLIELLRHQIAYAGWANERVMAAAANLPPDQLDHDFKTSEHSIRGTLTHIYRAERVWMSRIAGAPVAFKADGDDTMLALSDNWPRITDSWRQWSLTLTEEIVLANLSYHDLQNNAWSHPLWQAILHVVNHSTHHRGQAIGFIRALGHTPPNVDFIRFARDPLGIVS